MKKQPFPYLFLLCSLLLMVFLFKGESNPDYYTSENTAAGGPFESSSTTSRFALTEAIAENRTFTLNLEQAKFASPDVGVRHGKYFSLFTPGVSILALPLYILGKYIGLTGFFTLLLNPLLSLLNMFLIYKLAIKLGAESRPAFLSAFLFLFGSNAIGYAYTLSQHQAVTMVLLASLFVLLSDKTIINSIKLGFLVGLGLLFDIPTGIFLIPVLLAYFFGHFIAKTEARKINISINPSFLGMIIGVLPLMVLFGIYNRETTGSPVLLAQSVGRPGTEIGLKPDVTNDLLTQATASATPQSKSIFSKYNSRKLINGLYILGISNERGWLYYSPVLAIALLGLLLNLKKSWNVQLSQVVLSVILLILISYSMFGDPWGGWSYGPRYLIPGTALTMVFIPWGLSYLKSKRLGYAVFLFLAGLSLFLGALGAFSTTTIPPKPEAEYFSPRLHYTPEYNVDFIYKQGLSSYLYNTYLSRLIPPFLAIGAFVFFEYLIVVFLSIDYPKKSNKS